MPLNGAIIKAAGTNSVTGGTDVTFKIDGQLVTNGVHLVDISGTDFRTRRNITVKYRVPVQQKTNGVSSWSKDKKSVTVTCPRLLADGTVVYDLIRIEREVYPDATAAQATELNTLGAQVLFDTDFSDFWGYGSLG